MRYGLLDHQGAVLNVIELNPSNLCTVRHRGVVCLKWHPPAGCTVVQSSVVALGDRMVDGVLFCPYCTRPIEEDNGYRRHEGCPGPQRWPEEVQREADLEMVLAAVPVAARESLRRLLERF